MTPEQFEKLPKYAQNELRKLRRDVEYYEGIVRRELTGDLTNTFIRSYGKGARYRFQGLPNGCTIWLPATEDRAGPGITVCNDKDGVEVQGDHTSRLHIEPVMSNTVRAIAVPRYA